MMLKIEEAIAKAKRNGKVVKKRQIAEKLWPDSEPGAQQVNMTKLVSGKTKGIRPEWVVTICKMCDCDPNFLFDFDLNF